MRYTGCCLFSNTHKKPFIIECLVDIEDVIDIDTSVLHEPARILQRQVGDDPNAMNPDSAHAKLNQYLSATFAARQVYQ